MERKIIYTITTKDFEASMCRKPKNEEEFEKFVRYVEKGMNAQLDWEVIYESTEDAMESD